MHDATTSSAKTNMRFVSGLDSKNYKAFGFKVTGVSVDTNGDLEKVGNSQTKKFEGNERIVWNKLLVYNEKQVEGQDTMGVQHTPKVVLGDAAKYFITYRVDNVSKKNFGRIYSIQPFWTTFDGVEVTGLIKYAHIEDGLNGYVNIPINLNNNNKIASGLVEFDWSDLKAAGYTFKGAECGKTFKLQKTYVDGNVIRCITIVDITSENKGQNVKSNDIFINLRFEKGTAKTYDGNFYHFGVNAEDFSDMNENTIEGYDVWNIQY